MTQRTIAAFDFDKTLSTRDNVVPFLRLVGGRRVMAEALLAAAPSLMLRRRDAAKAAAVRRVFRDRSARDVRAEGERFATDVIANHLRDDMVARAAWHRSQGHELVVVSASLDAYLDPIGQRLGFNAVLASRLEEGEDGLLTGALDGPNVRGAEKVRRLEAWLDGASSYVWAYGDSSGDRELLARADHPVRV